MSGGNENRNIFDKSETNSLKHLTIIFLPLSGLCCHTVWWCHDFPLCLQQAPGQQSTGLHSRFFGSQAVTGKQMTLLSCVQQFCPMYTYTHTASDAPRERHKICWPPALLPSFDSAICLRPARGSRWAVEKETKKKREDGGEGGWRRRRKRREEKRKRQRLKNKGEGEKLPD